MAADEAQIRAELEQKIRAELEAEMRAEAQEAQRKQMLDAAFAPVVQSARREQNWDNRRPIQGAQKTEAARIIGAALSDQMVAGMPGTTLNEDGYGDGTG